METVAGTLGVDLGRSLQQAAMNAGAKRDSVSAQKVLAVCILCGAALQIMCRGCGYRHELAERAAFEEIREAERHLPPRIVARKATTGRARKIHIMG